VLRELYRDIEAWSLYEDIIFRWQTIFFNYQRLETEIKNRSLLEAASSLLLTIAKEQEIVVGNGFLGFHVIYTPEKVNHGIKAFIEEWNLDVYVAILDTDDLKPMHVSQIMNDAKSRDIERECVIFIRASTIRNSIPRLKATQSFTFKDCKWPVLLELQKKHGICSSCGRTGHHHTNCKRKFCIRCHRFGHLKSDCFAKVDHRGNRLDSY
jgi:hypothetical protein